MANHTKEFATEGYKAADGSLRVSVREPGRLWSQPANYTLTEKETLSLIQSLIAGLDEAKGFVPMGDIDPSPDCRCETCPQGGPYTCISTD